MIKINKNKKKTHIFSQMLVLKGLYTISNNEDPISHIFVYNYCHDSPLKKIKNKKTIVIID